MEREINDVSKSKKKKKKLNSKIINPIILQDELNSLINVDYNCLALWCPSVDIVSDKKQIRIYFLI